MGQGLSQTFPPAAKYSVDHIPDLSGKVMVVTGGNTGIGKEIVRALLIHNAKVYMASRNVAKGKAAIEELKKDTGKEALFLELDLASLTSVRRAAAEFFEKEKELHTLFNNGGIMFLTETQQSLSITEDGYDIQWGTNALGPFHLTQLLMPALLAAARNSNTNARVIFTSSIALSQGINFDTLKDTPARKKIGASERYGQSKLANIILAQEIARRYGDKGLIGVSLDPGGTKTGLQQHLPVIYDIEIYHVFQNLMLHPPANGALTSLFAGTSESTELNGKFLIPFARIGVASTAAQNPELGQRLWSYLEEEVKLK
ncbi:hypothetical protein J132_08238 [Termitomyces sp. J132]|nr:hypothetical protein J132_08238 [Termitomyces sp. J132]